MSKKNKLPVTVVEPSDYKNIEGVNQVIAPSLLATSDIPLSEKIEALINEVHGLVEDPKACSISAKDAHQALLHAYSRIVHIENAFKFKK